MKKPEINDAFKFVFVMKLSLCENISVKKVQILLCIYNCSYFDNIRTSYLQQLNSMPHYFKHPVNVNFYVAFLQVN